MIIEGCIASSSVSAKGKVVPVFREDVWGSRGIVPCVLDLHSRWQWMISFNPRPLYLQGNYLPYPWVSNSASLEVWRGEKSLLSVWIVRRSSGRSVRDQNAILTKLYQLVINCNANKLLLKIRRRNPVQFPPAHRPAIRQHTTTNIAYSCLVALCKHG